MRGLKCWDKEEVVVLLEVFRRQLHSHLGQIQATKIKQNNDYYFTIDNEFGLLFVKSVYLLSNYVTPNSLEVAIHM